MKRDFIKTRNIRNFIGAMQDLWNRADGIEGMGLVIGERGQGKTRASVWYHSNVEDSLYIRAKANWRPSWMMREIAAELGLPGDRVIENLHFQIINALRERPRLIFIDEIKHCLTSSRLIETCRDIYDESKTPIVFLAEVGAERSLARFPALFDRFNQIVHFTRLDNEDIEKIIATMLEVEMDAEAQQVFIDLVEKRFRPIIIGLFKIERWSKSSKIERVNASHVRRILGKAGSSRSSIAQPKKMASVALTA